MNNSHTVRNLFWLSLVLVVGIVVGYFIGAGVSHNQTASVYNLPTKQAVVAGSSTTDPCGVSGTGSPCNPTGLCEPMMLTT